ncbi:protein arginine methyltransferase [Heterostelium album PN500]|uniref:type I protein arginine methyltransferase n=1 Tax=Heterostelium pallidum (strain ATCC 26659 / Pp 5 / PN500) TaxID=670386 RepID=D3B626_HETP5|nr:protein arginine methyltransferase [Heterostelium album PN500]EFA83324.1 protein arginine methyltransferase [Heterostelium album PN500]|eukprot:XP_020435441.1 protein arginine methyltransferase [Heterostelium album PN500]
MESEKMNVCQNESLVDRQKDLTTSDYYFDSYSHFGIHEEMLKDEVRTLSYRKAILNNRHLFQGKVVLDVGCGTGILCMFAAQAGAKLVIGVDNSEILPIAQKIIKANNFENKIVLIKGKMEEVQLPVEKVDIIISEWMGYFMLYEGMLDTVLFARDKYLVPGGIIMPDRASLHITAIEDSDYKQDKIEYWNNVYGFDMSCIREIALAEPLVDVVQAKMIATTDCSILNIDIHTIKKEELPFRSDFKLKAMRDDCVHAFVVYFDIEFTKGHKTVFFSTGPRAQYTHWKQSILYLDDVLKLRQGEQITGSIDVAPYQANQRDLKIKLSYDFKGSESQSSANIEYHMR